MGFKFYPVRSALKLSGSRILTGSSEVTKSGLFPSKYKCQSYGDDLP